MRRPIRTADITWANIDAGYDLGVTGARVSSYIQTNPNTTAYLDNGFWEVGVARALRDLGYEPGDRCCSAGSTSIPSSSKR